MKKTILAAFAAALMCVGCAEAPRTAALLNEADYQTEIDGKPVGLYTLQSEGITMQVTNYGARIASLFVADREGNPTDVVLGYPTINGHLNGDGYAGPIVGRYGNRIGKGIFTLDGVEYTTTINNGENHLHGGVGGWSTHAWNVDAATDNSITLSYMSADGEEGYPGNVIITVTYTLCGNDLVLDYRATTDAPTVLNPTSHCYFNLHGDSEVSTNSHILKINAAEFTPTDAGLIPTGEIAALEGTPLDFRTPTAIGERIEAEFEALTFGAGYDHNFILDKATPNEAGLTEAAVLYEPANGIEMTILTDQVALQFYSGNFFDGSTNGKYGKPLSFRESVALETQKHPDAINHDGFPSIVLNPDEVYTHVCIYKFYTK